MSKPTVKAEPRAPEPAANVVSAERLEELRRARDARRRSDRAFGRSLLEEAAEMWR